MAAHFVSPPCAVDWTDACRSWTQTGSLIHTTSSINCEPSPLENVSRVRGHGPWCAPIRTHTLETSWSRPRGGMLGRSSTLLEGEGSHEKNWVKRPIFPTLLGYEILEERAKFTVYKILVTGGRGDSWVIFRRYTDFCRLNDKLKELFPSSGLALPPKRWFKDNYDEEFLEERQIGLRTFLQNLTLHKDIISSEAVRHFLCLGYPPSPFDSLEESRAFCETLEETNHRLQRELLENQREAKALKGILEEQENRICLLVKKVKSLTLSSESFERHRQLKAELATDPDTHREGDTVGNEGADDDRGYSVTEPDELIKGHGAYLGAEVSSPVA